MKAKLLMTLTTALLFFIPNASFGQAIDLGIVSDFALFSTNGGVSNTGISQVTGHVGSNNGSSTGFGNVNGIMHDNDGTSAQCAADLLIAYNQLNSAIPTFFPSSLLGNGDTLVAGIYSIDAASTLDLELILNAEGDPNAQFIFQINGAFSTGAESKVLLINGAMACNVFWKIEGLVSMAPGTFMKGTVIANNAAITVSTRDTIEGRVLSTTGAITIDGALVYTPIGCSSPYLTGPIAPDLKTTKFFTLFSANGAVTNAGVTAVNGSVGTNVGLTVGFDPLLVSCSIYPIPDVFTAQCAADLIDVYDYLNVLPSDIELLYPAQFGRNLVLTPHAYIMNSAAVFTDSLFLNAQGNPDAVFVIKINGALTTSTFSKVLLINEAQAENVYWLVEGAASISENSVFCGTIICNNGALELKTGVTLNGRAYTTLGSLSSAAITTIMPTDCISTGIEKLNDQNSGQVVSIKTNPSNTSITIQLNDASGSVEYTLLIYNVLGEAVVNTYLTKQTTILETSQLHSGIYLFKVMKDNALVQSGKMLLKR